MSVGSQVGEIIMRLMMESNRRGQPIKPSAELEDYLRRVASSETALQGGGTEASEMLEGAGDKLSIINERTPFPERGPAQDTMEDLDPSQYTRGDQFGLEEQLDLPAAPLARNPENEFNAAPDEGPADPMPMRPANDMMLFVWARNPQGKAVRLDGPFQNEIEAMRELKALREAGAGNLQLFVGPMPE